MKESMQRIVTWAKAHPWLAALIVGAVILVGWFVYKRMSSTGSGQTTQGVPLGDVAGQPSTNGDVTTSPGALGYGGAGSAAPPVILPQPNPISALLGGGGSGGSGGFAPIGDSGFGYPLPSAVGGYDLGTPLAADAAAVPASAGTLAKMAAAISGPPKGATLLQNVVSPSKLYMPASLPGASASGNPTGKTAAANAIAKTPAQAVGKGAKFTGTFQGVTYVNGFPVGYGGYNQQGGFTYTIPTATGGTFTQTISQAMINYGSRTPTTTKVQPSGYAVLHGG